MSDEQQQSGAAFWEKHMQTAAIAALIGLNAWTANMAHSTALSIATLTAKIETFRNDVDRLESRIDRLESRITAQERLTARD